MRWINLFIWIFRTINLTGIWFWLIGTEILVLFKYIYIGLFQSTLMKFQLIWAQIVILGFLANENLGNLARKRKRWTFNEISHFKFLFSWFCYLSIFTLFGLLFSSQELFTPLMHRQNWWRSFGANHRVSGQISFSRAFGFSPP